MTTICSSPRPSSLPGACISARVQQIAWCWQRPKSTTWAKKLPDVSLHWRASAHASGDWGPSSTGQRVPGRGRSCLGPTWLLLKWTGRWLCLSRCGKVSDSSSLECSIHLPKGRHLFKKLVAIRKNAGLGMWAEWFREQKAFLGSLDGCDKTHRLVA